MAGMTQANPSPLRGSELMMLRGVSKWGIRGENLGPR